MRSQQVSEIRAQAAYSPRWLLVPMVPVLIVFAVWFLTVPPRGTADAAPVVVDSIDTTVVQQHGA